MSHDVIKSTFHCTFDNSHFHHQHHHHIACVSTIRGCLPTQKLLLTNKPIPFHGDEEHTSYMSREPRVYPCKFFLAGINFYRFNAKNWHFRQILREKVAFFFTDLTQKIGVFRCKFYSPKILPV